MQAFIGRWVADEPPSPPPHAKAKASSQLEREAMRGSALECTLFSAMAIGGLLLGCPTKAVARHMAAARRLLHKFRTSLAEKPAVSALILYGLANALLPPCEVPGGGITGGGGGGGGHDVRGGGQQEYRKSLDDAKAVFVSLEVKDQDPLVNAFMTYRATCDNLVAFVADVAYSANPVNISGRRGVAPPPPPPPLPGTGDSGSGGGGGGGNGGDDQGWTDAGSPAVVIHQAPKAHPAYVVADSEWWHVQSLREVDRTGGRIRVCLCREYESSKQPHLAVEALNSKICLKQLALNLSTHVAHDNSRLYVFIVVEGHRFFADLLTLLKNRIIL